MLSLKWLARVLDASVARKPETPLTNSHLLNIVKLAIRAEANHSAKVDEQLNEVLAEDKIWGN